MNVTIYTDGAAGETRTAPADMARFFSLWTQKGFCMRENSVPDIKRLPITAWN